MGYRDACLYTPNEVDHYTCRTKTQGSEGKHENIHSLFHFYSRAGNLVRVSVRANGMPVFILNKISLKRGQILTCKQPRLNNPLNANKIFARAHIMCLQTASYSVYSCLATNLKCVLQSHVLLKGAVSLIL